MDVKLIYGGEATVEDIELLAGLGFRFDVEDGAITHIYEPRVRYER